MKTWWLLVGLAAATLQAGPSDDWPARLTAFRLAQRAWGRGDIDGARRFYDRAAKLPASTDPVQAKVLERLNEHRFQAMVVPVMPHPAVARAAQAHADYLARHTRTKALSLAQAHGETPGRAGFTGSDTAARIARQGARGGSTEAVTSELDPEGAVDILVNSVYHRSGLLRQEARYAGFGVSTQAVLDLFWKAGSMDEMEFSHYPGSGQTQVPPRFPGGETPDPMPGAVYPVGPPLSFGASGRAPELLSVHLTGPEGVVPVRILGPGTSPRVDLMGDWAYAMPVEPLSADGVYQVRAEVSVAGKPRTVAFDFRTGARVPGEQYARLKGVEVPRQEVLPGRRVRFRAHTEASHPKELRIRWSIDGAVQQDGGSDVFEWSAVSGSHQVEVRLYYERGKAFTKKEFTFRVPGADGAPLAESAGPPTRDFSVDPPPPWRTGQVVRLEAKPPEVSGPVTYLFRVDGEVIGEGPATHATWRARPAAHHRFEVEARYAGGSLRRYLEVRLQ